MYTPEVFFMSQVPYFIVVLIFLWEGIRIRKNILKTSKVVLNESASRESPGI